MRKREHHGMYKTPEYQAWADMIIRCRNKRHPWYSSYGGRGIKICPQWLLFSQFYRDMGKRPDGHTLGRIDNNGDYSPSNCRWETRRQQSNNTRQNRLITFRGRTMTVAQWGREIGLCFQTMVSRFKIGWSVEKALTTPKMNKFGRAR